MELVSLNKENFDSLVDKELSGSSGFFGKKSFLQSSFWGSIQESYGRRCLYLAVKNKEEYLSLSLVIETSFLLGKLKYWYFPRGPIFKEGLSDNDKEKILELFKKNAVIGRVCFLRIESPDQCLTRAKKLRKTKDIQPAKTSFLDLRKNMEDILSEMKQKTRYNIRLAEKKEVQVVEQMDAQVATENFLNLIKETAVRDDFSIHSDNYYQHLIKFKENIKVFEAYYQGRVVAAGIFSFFDNCVTYLHGASSNTDRNIMAPYLLHFSLLNIAQKLGFSFYDFYGVDDRKWPGVSRFKRGFGGEDFEYPGTFDLPTNNFMYRFYKTFRRLKKVFT